MATKTKAAPKTTKNAKALKANPAPAAKAAEPQAETKAKPAAKPVAKPAAERDALGQRIGSQAAAINAKLGAKPITVAAIAESTGINAGRVRAHLASLINKEKAKAGDDGYVLIKGKAK